MVTIASRSLIARSKSLSSVATFTRLIKRLQVSPPDDIQIAQMRSSIALALASSGAIFSALKSVSRVTAGLPRPGAGLVAGGLVGADGKSRVPCPKVGCASAETARNASVAVATTDGNRTFIPINLFARGAAASDKTAGNCGGDRGEKPPGGRIGVSL